MIPLRRFLKDENGTATIEFLMVFPVIMTIFFASFESSFFMIRHVMLERSVDIVVRGIRLGQLDYMTTFSQAEQHKILKELICEESALVSSVADCIQDLRIWLQPINTADFAMLAPTRYCVDTSAPIDPADPGPPTTEFALGTDNEIMLMSVCLKQEPIFPSSIVGAQLVADGEGDGSYALMTNTIFVNEPG